MFPLHPTNRPGWGVMFPLLSAHLLLGPGGLKPTVAVGAQEQGLSQRHLMPHQAGQGTVQ